MFHLILGTAEINVQVKDSLSKILFTRNSPIMASKYGILF